jgi:hypothetical protein
MYSIQALFFVNIFNVQLIEATEVQLIDMDSQLYSMKVKYFLQMLGNSQVINPQTHILSPTPSTSDYRKMTPAFQIYSRKSMKKTPKTNRKNEKV